MKTWKRLLALLLVFVQIACFPLQAAASELNEEEIAQAETTPIVSEEETEAPAAVETLPGTTVDETVPQVAAEETEAVAENSVTGITLWTYPIGLWGDSAAVEELIASFTAVTGIEVTVSYLDYSTGDSTVNSAIAEGTTPDVIMEGPERLVSTWSGHMVDLSDLLDDTDRSEIYAGALNACYGSDGNLYEYPLAGMVHSMAINKTVFEAAGAMQYIDQETHTWNSTEDFFNAVQAVYEYTGTTVGTVYCGGRGGDQGTRALVNNLYSGSFTDSAHTGYTWASDANIAALEALNNCEGISFDSSIAGGDEINMFLNGSLNMSICWNVNQQMNNSTTTDGDEIMFLAFPSNGTPQLCGGVWGFGVFNNGDEAKIEAAKTFVQYMCDSSATVKAVQTSTYFPVRSAAANADMSSVWADDIVMSEYSKLMQYMGDYYVTTPNWSESRNSWISLLQAVGEGQDVAEAASYWTAVANGEDVEEDTQSGKRLTAFFCSTNENGEWCMGGEMFGSDIGFSMGEFWTMYFCATYVDENGETVYEPVQVACDSGAVVFELLSGSEDHQVAEDAADYIYAVYSDDMSGLGSTVTIYAVDDPSVTTTMELLPNDVGWYTAEDAGYDSFIKEYAMDPYADEHVVYIALRHRDGWPKITDIYDDSGNGEIVAIEMVNDYVWKITLNTDVVRDACSMGYDLSASIRMIQQMNEEGDTEDWYGGLYCYPAERYPYLTIGCLEDWGEGWFENADGSGWGRGFDLIPGDCHNLIYYVNYWDESGEEVRQPVNITASENINLTLLADTGETIREGEENSQYFYRLTTDSIDQETYVACDWQGITLRMPINNSLNELDFFSEPERNNDYHLYSYQLDPNADENSFYVSFAKEGWTLTNVTGTSNDGITTGGAAYVKEFTRISDTVWKITLDPDMVLEACRNQETWWVDLWFYAEDSEGNWEEIHDGIECLWSFVPHLAILWMQNEGEGWYLNGDVHRGTLSFPTVHDQYFCFAYGYLDEEGNEVYMPVHVTGDGLNITQISDTDIREDQEYGEYFCIVSAEAAGDYTINYETDGMNLSMSLQVTEVPESGIYSEPTMSADTYLDYYQMDANAEENSFYFGFQSDYWALVDVATGWDGWAWAGAEHVESIEALENGMYKITLNADSVYQYCYNQESFGLDLCYVVEDPDGNQEVRSYGLSCEWSFVPHLSVYWLENWGEGWFLTENYGQNFGFSSVHEMWACFMYRYIDENGEEVSEPVYVTSDSLNLELLTDLDEYIREDQELAGYFYRVSAETAGDYIITMDGNDRMILNVHVDELPETGIYSEPTMSADIYLDYYQMDANADENSFYFGFQSDYWTLVDVATGWDGWAWAGAEHVESIEALENGMYKITLNADSVYQYCYNQEGFWLDLCYVVEDPDGNQEVRSYGLSCEWSFVPHLAILWMQNEGEGWYLNGDVHRGTLSFPTVHDQYFCFAYGYLDEEGNEVYMPVHVTGDGLNITQISDTDIREDQEYGEYFCIVSAEAAGDYTINYEIDGMNLSMSLQVTEVPESGIYSEPTMSADIYLDYYQMDANADENSFYFGFQSDYWTLVDVATGWDGWAWAGAEHVESIEALENGMYKITLNADSVYQYCYNQEGFGLDLCYVVEDPDGNQEVRSYGLSCEWSFVPHLSVYWLENWGDGWFLTENYGQNFGFSSVHEMWACFMYRYIDENGDEVSEPVYVTSDSLNLELLTDLDAYIREDQELAGYFYRVSAEAAGDYIITMDGNDRMTLNVHVDELPEEGWYTSPEPSRDSYIDSYSMDPYADENVFYFAFASDYWTLEDAQLVYNFDEEGNPVYADEDYPYASIEQVEDTEVYKITLNPDAVLEYCLNDEVLPIQLATTVVHRNDEGDIEREEIWGPSIWCFSSVQMPYLSYSWIDNWGEGWFDDDEDNQSRELGFPATEERWVCFYYNYMNEDGEWVSEPVHVTSPSEDLILTLCSDLEDPYFRADETNGEYFCRITATENAWDQTFYLTCEEDENATIPVRIQRDEFAFYDSPELSNESYVGQPYVNPLEEEHALYFGSFSDYWTLVDVYMTEDCAGYEQVTDIADMGEGVYQFTFAECEEGYDLMWYIQVQDPYGNTDTWVYQIWVQVAVPEPAAYLSINYTEYVIYEGYDKVGYHAFSGEYTEEGEEIWSLFFGELPEGVSYDLESNTITLDNAALTNLAVAYAVEYYDENGDLVDTGYRLPSADLTINLIGENTISSDHDTVLGIGDGINAVFSGDGSLYLSNEYLDGVVWIGNATLTLADSVQVVAETLGEFLYYDEEETDLCTWRKVIWGHEGSALTIQDSASLITKVPECTTSERIFFIGIDSINNITVSGGYLETNYLEISQENSSYVQTGGEVSITGLYYPAYVDENDVTVYNAEGMLIYTGGTMEISGGKLNIDVSKISGAENYAWGLTLIDSAFDLSGGEVVVNMGIRGEGIILSGNSTLTQNGGTLTVTAPEIGADYYDVVGVVTEAEAGVNFLGGVTEFTNARIECGGWLNINGGNVVVNESFAADSGVMDRWGGPVLINTGANLYMLDGELVINTHNGYSNLTICGTMLQTDGSFTANITFDEAWFNSFGDEYPTIARGLDVCGGTVTVSGGTQTFNGGSRAYDVVYDESIGSASVKITGGTVNMEMMSRMDNYSSVAIFNYLSAFEMTGGVVNVSAADFGFYHINSDVSITGGSMNLNTLNRAWTGIWSNEISDEFGNSQIDLGEGMNIYSNTSGDILEIVNRSDSYEYDGNTYEEIIYSLEEDDGVESATNVSITDITRINFTGSTATLGNSLAINFVLDTSKLDGNGHYAVITKSYADGTTATQVIQQSDWAVYSGKLYYFTFSGVRAKEMTDEMSIIVYNSEGQQVTNERVESMRDYVMRALAKEEEKTSPDARKLTLYVDMLNYGAAAQVYFDNYHGDDLANSRLTEAQKAYATTEAVGEDIRKTDVGYAGATLILADEIVLNFVYNNSTIDNAAYAIVSLTHHDGSEMTVRIEADDFGYFSSTRTYVSVNGMKIADYAQAVTLTLYDADGNALSTVVDSVGGYISRVTNPSELYTMILRFGVSAYNSFH